MPKKKCWKIIEKEYNAQSVIAKSEKQLKDCWMNIKLKFKKDASKKKIDLMKTGGGPSEVPSVVENPLLIELIGPSITSIRIRLMTMLRCKTKEIR